MSSGIDKLRAKLAETAPARRVAVAEKGCHGYAKKADDEDEDDLTDPEPGGDGDDDGESEGESDDLQDHAYLSADDYEDQYAEQTIVPLYRAWKSMQDDPETKWPEALPSVLRPQPQETPGAFAARAAAYLRTTPEGRRAFEAVGENPEWNDWVTAAMQYADRAPGGMKAPEVGEEPPAAQPAPATPKAKPKGLERLAAASARRKP